MRRYRALFNSGSSRLVYRIPQTPLYGNHISLLRINSYGTDAHTSHGHGAPSTHKEHDHGHSPSAHKEHDHGHGAKDHGDHAHDDHGHGAKDHGDHAHDDHGHGYGDHHHTPDYPPPMRTEWPTYGFDIGESTCWERKDDKVYINQYNGRPERWIDVEELFTEEYWQDENNWDEHDYLWKCKVDRMLEEYLGITDLQKQREFRANYEISQGHATLDWINRSPPDDHTYEDTPPVKVNPLLRMH